MVAAAAAPAPPINMQDLSGFIQRARECNTGLEELPTLTPFAVAGKEAGKLKPKCVAIALWCDSDRVHGDACAARPVPAKNMAYRAFTAAPMTRNLHGVVHDLFGWGGKRGQGTEGRETAVGRGAGARVGGGDAARAFPLRKGN